MNLLHDFTIKGKWWIHNYDHVSEDDYFGELLYSKPDKIELILEGSFFNTTSIFRAVHNFTIPVIHGKSKDGRLITLINIRGNEVGRNDWIYTELRAETLMINEDGHFAVADMEVSSINFSSNLFHSFFRGFNNFSKLGITDLKFEFDLDKEEIIELVDNEQVNIYFYFSKSLQGLAVEETTIHRKIYFNIQCKKLLTLKESIQAINYYKDFFSFFCDPVICFDSINVFAPNEKQENTKFNLLIPQNIKQLGASIRPYNIFIDYTEVSHNIKNLLLCWINNDVQNKNLLALYMQSKYLHFPSEIQLFLNMVFAIETLHSNFFNYKVFTEEELLKFRQEKKKAIEEVFSPVFKSRLHECLGHFSDPSFSLRLKDLISMNEFFVKDYIEDVEQFVKNVTRQRNYLAHNHLPAENAAFGSDEYGYYSAILKMIFECAFLKKLGFEEKQLQLMIKRNFNYDTQKQKIIERKQRLV